jgi:hypothetical protein
MKYLEAEWIRYRDQVIKQAPGIDKAKMCTIRAIFIRGACALHTLIMNNLEPGSGPPSKNDLKMMADINDELVEFGKEGFEDERSK